MLSQYLKILDENNQLFTLQSLNFQSPQRFRIRPLFLAASPYFEFEIKTRKCNGDPPGQ